MILLLRQSDVFIGANMDSGTNNLITYGISTLGGIVLAYIAYKTAQLNKKVDEVKEQTNGILLATTKAKDHAEGKSEAAVEIAAAAVKPP